MPEEKKTNKDKQKGQIEKYLKVPYHILNIQRKKSV